MHAWGWAQVGESSVCLGRFRLSLCHPGFIRVAGTQRVLSEGGGGGGVVSQGVITRGRSEVRSGAGHGQKEHFTEAGG